MRSLLVPYHDEDVARCGVAVAGRIARQFNSYVEGLYVKPLPQIIAGEGITVPGAYVAPPIEEADGLATEARARFDALIAEAGIPPGEVSGDPGAPAAGWVETEGLESQVVAERGRLFDMVVVGRGASPATPDWNALCEGALFEAGRPVLVAPASLPETLGESIVIAWNASTETARTVALGMPFIERASSVLVLTVQGGTVAGPEGEHLANHLVRHGVRAQARTIDGGGRSVGEAILDETARVGADLLFKGAYTQSRLRQMIFGGATRHILSHATLPVLLAH